MAQPLTDAVSPLADAAIDGDRGLLSQLLLNLLRNAAQAASAHRDAPAVRLSIAETPDTVTIAVEDNGPGVPIELRQEVFLPFFTTRATAAGLGLATAAGVVQSIGGHISLESEEGKGTAVTIRLPA